MQETWAVIMLIQMISVIYRLYVKELGHFCSVENVKRIVYRNDTGWGFLTAVKAAN